MSTFPLIRQTLVIGLIGLGALSQLASAGDTMPPSYDLKPQALQDLQILQQHFADLAAAVPADKFTWRPGEGVRSFSEVFLHVASLNFSLAPISAPRRLPASSPRTTKSPPLRRLLSLLRSTSHSTAFAPPSKSAPIRNYRE